MPQTVDPNNEGRAKEEAGKQEQSENPSDPKGFTGWEPDEEQTAKDTPRHQPVNQQDDQ